MSHLDKVIAEGRARGLLGGREVRSGGGTSLSGAGTRSAADGWTLAGHAAVFDQETVIAGLWRESIAPGAFRDVLGDDVRHLLNHDPNLVLGRTKAGTLRISEDRTGLAFECDLNREDSLARDVRAKVSRGDISQSSFAFTIKEEEWEDGRTSSDGKTRQLPHRRILRMKQLFDTSTVAYPAYEGADTGVRTTGGRRSGLTDSEYAAAAMAARHAFLQRLLG